MQSRFIRSELPVRHAKNSTVSEMIASMLDKRRHVMSTNWAARKQFEQARSIHQNMESNRERGQQKFHDELVPELEKELYKRPDAFRNENARADKFSDTMGQRNTQCHTIQGLGMELDTNATRVPILNNPQGYATRSTSSISIPVEAVRHPGAHAFTPGKKGYQDGYVKSGIDDELDYSHLYPSIIQAHDLTFQLVSSHSQPKTHSGSAVTDPDDVSGTPSPAMINALLALVSGSEHEPDTSWPMDLHAMQRACRRGKSKCPTTMDKELFHGQTKTQSGSAVPNGPLVDFWGPWVFNDDFSEAPNVVGRATADSTEDGTVRVTLSPNDDGHASESGSASSRAENPCMNRVVYGDTDSVMVQLSDDERRAILAPMLSTTSSTLVCISPSIDKKESWMQRYFESSTPSSKKSRKKKHRKARVQSTKLSGKGVPEKIASPSSNDVNRLPAKQANAPGAVSTRKLILHEPKNPAFFAKRRIDQLASEFETKWTEQTRSAKNYVEKYLDQHNGMLDIGYPKDSARGKPNTADSIATNRPSNATLALDTKTNSNSDFTKQDLSTACSVASQKAIPPKDFAFFVKQHMDQLALERELREDGIIQSIAFHSQGDPKWRHATIGDLVGTSYSNDQKKRMGQVRKKTKH